MSTAESNNQTIVCSYCKGHSQCPRLGLLEDDLFNLMCKLFDYSRSALFCFVCIGRMQNKLNCVRENQLRRQWYTDVAGDTDDTDDEYVPELPSSQESSSTENSQQDTQNTSNGSVSAKSSTANRENHLEASESPTP